MFKISLNRVHDKIKVQEGNEALTLRVDADPMTIAAKMRTAALKLQNADEMTEEERNKATIEMSDAIFGMEQSNQLFALYNGDASCVMAVLSKYVERLTKIITKAQKNIK